MALVKLLLAILHLHNALAQDQVFSILERPFGTTRLTSERGGPPMGAEFSQIQVVNLPESQPDLSRRPYRPNLGRPPPPPPIKPPPTKRPRPKPSAPQPLPIPLPSNQGIPLRPQSGKVPSRPHHGLTVRPVTVRPDLETVATTLPPPPTTTPNTADHLPAYYHRFIQNEDGSYYFDFANPNNIQRLEQGFFKHDNLREGDFPVLVKSGAYSYISPEGYHFRVDYVADERGYRSFQHHG